MKIKHSWPLFIILLSVRSFAQLNVQTSTLQVPQTVNRGCATGILPQQFESWVQALSLNTNKYGQGQVQSVYNIPVIVHVIHNNETVNTLTATTGNNLNAAQIQNQINILNTDFNGNNPDTSLIPTVFKPALGKFQFNFCLAVVNPTGGVLTEPGIDRIDRNVKGWNAPPYSQAYINSTIKPNSIWDPTKYMNMWVCGITGGILGFATFPNPGTSGLSGLNPPYGSTTTDGLVMLNTAFGSVGTASTGGAYNKGRTATHEIGHWLGLRHIWGDGTCATDYCADTPPAQNANYGCPTHPYKLGTCTGNTTGEMTMNYMDYTDDACMYMFSNDQKTRAQLIMTNSPLRATLLTSTVCNLPTVTNDIGILYVTSPTYSQAINCNNFINPVLTVHNFGSNTITTATYSFNVDGVSTQTMVWTGTLLPNTSGTVTLPAINNIGNGAHTFSVGVYSPNNTTDPNMGNNKNTQQFSTSGSFLLSIIAPTLVCAGSQAVLTASGTATSYSWNPGAITGTMAVITPTATTIYTLTGKTGTCVNTRTVSLVIGTPATVTVNSATVCSGASTFAAAAGACSYTWMPGNVSSPFSPTSTTAYTVTGSCPGGCPGTATGTITVQPAPSVTLTASPAGMVCPGTSVNLSASGASAYLWNTGQTGNQITAVPLTSTIYTVTGSVATCAQTRTVLVSVGGTPFTLNIQPGTATVCAGSAITLTASGATSYSWNTGANTPVVSVSPVTTTTYSLSATNGPCSSSTVKTVSVLANPLVSVLSVPGGTVCPGTQVSLSASGANSYQWSTGSSSSVIVVTPTATTVYTVTGSNNTCTNSKTVSVNVGGSSINVSVNANTLVTCAGGTVQLNATGAVTYSWSTGATGQNITVTPQQTTTYTVTGMSGGCSGFSGITVTVIPSSQLTVSPDVTLCPGQQATLTASGSYSVISWNGFAQGIATIVVTPSVSSIYSVSGSGSPGGCSAIAQVAVTLTNSPVSQVTSKNSVCDGCTGSLIPNTSGGTAPYTYSLSNSNCSVPCTSLCPGLYTLYTFDTNGCKSINYFSIACSGSITGLTEYDNSSFIIYPNPANNEITIDSKHTLFSITVENTAGQLIYFSKENLGSKVLNVSGYASGLYLVKIRSGNEFTVKKFVKE